jgi:hypothetical protein
VHGIPEPVRLWDWHLRQAPEYRGRIGWKRRARLTALRAAGATERGVRAVGRGSRGGTLDRVYALVRNQLYVDAEPERLFGTALPATSFDRLFFLLTHDSQETTVEPVDPEEVARRMLFSLQHERKELLAAYWKLRFAFPDAASALIAEAALIERDRLLAVFRGKPAYVVRHPYPTSLDGLYAEMRQYC